MPFDEITEAEKALEEMGFARRADSQAPSDAQSAHLPVEDLLPSPGLLYSPGIMQAPGLFNLPEKKE